MDTFNSLPDTFWAWLAGFMDGDGCIMNVAKKNSRHWNTAVTFLQKEPEPLRFIRDRLQTGGLFLSGRGYWQLRFGSATSRDICARILPYLTLPGKIERAKKAATWAPSPWVGPRGPRRSHAERMKRAQEMYVTGSFSIAAIAQELAVSWNTARRWVRPDSSS